MIDSLYPTGPNGLTVFIFVTLVLGGAAAWATGRAIAMTWKPLWQLAFYMLLMTFAVRFMHYALFRQPFLTPGNVIVDYIALTAIAYTGYLVMRSSQMPVQYPWLFERSGPIGWRRKD